MYHVDHQCCLWSRTFKVRDFRRQLWWSRPYVFYLGSVIFSNHNIIWIRETKEKWIKIAQIGTWFGFDFIWFGCEFIFNGVAMIAKTGLQQVMFTVSLSGRKKARKTGRKGHKAVSKRTIVGISKFCTKMTKHFCLQNQWKSELDTNTFNQILDFSICNHTSNLFWWIEPYLTYSYRIR